MGLLNNVIQVIRYWIFGKNYVRSIGSGEIEISSSASIVNTKIYVYSGASLIIEENCKIKRNWYLPFICDNIVS